jgi:SNF2 family DNA or RNA helicase
MINSELTDDQRKAFDKFSKLKVGALFMKMGTGKTRVAFMLSDYNDINELIYIAPFSAIDNLKNEKEKWNPKSPITFIGYETISESDSSYIALIQRINEQKEKRMIVADESIFIKNDSSLRFKRLCEIRKSCQYALILNGTPITKNEWDIYNQMYFLSPKIFNMTREEFLSTFFCHVTYKKRNEKQHDFWKFSEVNADLLKKMIDPYVFRCDLDLAVRESEEKIMIQCTLTDYQESKERYLSRYLKEGRSSEIINMLSYLNHLSSLADEKCSKVALTASGRRAIVFYGFKDEGEKIKKMMNGECFMIDGSIGKDDRSKTIELFSKSNKPLLISFGCGSYSLNLQFCSEIIYSSLTFDYGRFEQSKFRIKRIGQDHPIRYTFILTDCGINKMIMENLDRKANLEDLVKDRLEKGDTQWLKDI